jgi:hypothetical protein
MGKLQISNFILPIEEEEPVLRFFLNLQSAIYNLQFPHARADLGMAPDAPL